MQGVYETGVYETQLVLDNEVIELGTTNITYITKYIRNNNLIEKAIVIVNGVEVKCKDIKKFNNFGIVRKYQQNRSNLKLQKQK